MGAPDFPLNAQDVERLTAGELKVAMLARKNIRKEVMRDLSEVKYFEGRKDLATVKVDINKNRLKKAARNVKAKEGALRHAALAAESEGGEEELGPTPPRSSPPPEADIVDLTADEEED